MKCDEFAVDYKERAKQLQREYQREYRRNNKDKVKKWNENYWINKAKKESIKQSKAMSESTADE